MPAAAFAAFIAIFSIVEVTVGGFGSHRDPPPTLPMPPGAIALLNITVTEPDGSTRNAVLECGRENKGSGYLTRKALAIYACETMLINSTVLDYLTGGDVSGPSCTKRFNPPPPAYVVHFEGTTSDGRFKRTLDVANDPCGEALAVIMFPLLESTAEGPSLGGL